MVPAPTLEELIESVEADAPSTDALDQLSQASRTASGLEAVSDALLDHFVDRSRRSGHSWTRISAALGVSKQAAHKRFALTPATVEPGSPTFERFTPRAQASLDAASEQARRYGHAQATTKDLLLALFEPAEAISAQVLRAAGITREACETHQGGEPLTAAQSGSAASPPFTEETQKVLRSSVAEALRLRHNYVGTEHLLLGLYSDRDDPAAKTLTALGLDYDAAKNRVTARLDEITKKASPE